MNPRPLYEIRACSARGGYVGEIESRWFADAVVPRPRWGDIALILHALPPLPLRT